MLKRFLPLLLISIFFAPFFSARATDFTSPNFIVKDPVLKTGAGFSTSSNFQLWGAIGQEAIGTSSAPTFGLRAGFLFFPAPAAPPPPAPPPSVPPPTSGGGAFPQDEFERLRLGLPIELPLEIILPACPNPIPADFNCDGVVGFVDLSILLFYFDESGAEFAVYDMSGNGSVGMADVSILFYYWDEGRT